MRLLTSLCATLLLAVSCGGELSEEESFERDISEIVGGSRYSNSSVVAVYVYHGGTRAWDVCTGTLISPRAVLTAAHCIADPSSWAYVLKGSNASTATASDWVNVTQRYVDGRYPEQVWTGYGWIPGFDWGVVILEKPIAARPVALNCKLMDEDIVGKTMRVVGKGLRNPRDPNSWGVMMSKSLRVDDYNVQHLIVNERSGGTCAGDSGGPWLRNMNGKTRIAAVSAGESGGCTWSYGQRIDIFGRAIRDTVRRHEPGYDVCD